jgi:hypothetical protein
MTTSAERGPDRKAETMAKSNGRERLHGDSGEGVISAAIAVLIMAFLGALMWVGFRRIWEGAERNTETKVQQIGSD